MKGTEMNRREFVATSARGLTAVACLAAGGVGLPRARGVAGPVSPHAATAEAHGLVLVEWADIEGGDEVWGGMLYFDPARPEELPQRRERLAADARKRFDRFGVPPEGRWVAIREERDPADRPILSMITHDPTGRMTSARERAMYEELIRSRWGT